MKKIVSTILSVLILCSVVIVPAGAITQSDFDSKISALRAEYPDGSFWANKRFDGATECMGFAYLMANRVFGGSARNWDKVYTLSGVKAGDVIRYSNSSKGHSIFVTGVKGSTIYYVDCNGTRKYCEVKWDNQVQIGATCRRKTFQYRLVAPALTNPTPQIGVTKPVASVYGDSTGNNVKLTWDSCNLATGYDVRIYDANGKNIKIFWNVQGTSVSTSLPTGSYSADIATLSNGNWRFGNKTSFNVQVSQIGVTKPTVSTGKYSNSNNVKLSWDSCNLATGYDVRIYDANGKNVKIFWNVQGTSVSASLTAGSYSADIATLSNGKWRFGDKTSFEVQIGVTKPVVSIVKDSAGNNVKLTWDACNLATGYDVRIYDANGKNIKIFWNVQGTSVSTSLPAGSYSADIATLSNGKWRFGDKTSFDLQIGVTKPTISIIKDSAGNNVKLTWDACNLATGYDVRIYDANGKNIKIFWNVQGTSVSTYLPVGSYSADIATLSNGNWRFGNKTSFDVQIGVTKPVVSIVKDSAGNNVKLTWDDCNLATGYDVRIYDASGKNIKIFWNVQGTSVSTYLPAGSYSADIATLSNGSWRFGSKTAFNVK